MADARPKSEAPAGCREFFGYRSCTVGATELVGDSEGIEVWVNENRHDSFTAEQLSWLCAKRRGPDNPEDFDCDPVNGQPFSATVGAVAEPTKLYALLDASGAVVEVSPSLTSIDELEQLRLRQGKSSSVVPYTADGSKDCPELKALRSIVYDMESYFADSGWHNLAREMRLRRIWAAGCDRLSRDTKRNSGRRAR